MLKVDKLVCKTYVKNLSQTKKKKRQLVIKLIVILKLLIVIRIILFSHELITNTTFIMHPSQH
jgi:hypothetical protein